MKVTTATSILALTSACGVIALRPATVAAQTVEPAKPSTELTESAQFAQATGTSGTNATTRASEGARLEEIVVTATRRSERLQDVPVSVLAFSREKIDAGGLNNIDDLARMSPGVTFQRTSGNYNDEGSDINIRGVDSTAGTSTTGIYIDDTPIQVRQLAAGSINAYPALFDLDRVEVLRGPQGTLFGAGAEGGAVRFISPEPDLGKVSAYSRADIADTRKGGASYLGGGAFGAPIIDGVLAFRASVSFERAGGWVDRVGYNLVPDPAATLPTPIFNGHTAEANANWQETATARLAVKWKVNDSLEISPSIYYQRLRINDTSVYWLPLSNPGANVYRNGNAGTNSSNDPFTLSAIKLKWDLGFASLLSNTSFYARDQSATSDYTQYLRATWSNAGVLANTFPAAGDNGYAPFRNRQRNFYQEIRLASKDMNARVIWSGGLFYSHLKENVSESIIDPTLNQEVINYTAGFPGGPYSICTPGDPVLQCPGGLLFNGPLEQVVDKQVALFGEIGLKLTDTLKATAGLRVSKLDYTGSAFVTGPFLGETLDGSGTGSEKPITPKAVLSWQPDHDNMVYASASKGFRTGGTNAPLGASCAANLSALGINQTPHQYVSDNLWSYEIGSKNTFFDHTLQINSSLFYIDWNKIQQSVYLPACGAGFTANLGKAKSEGGDIEVLYKPFDAMTLDLTAAYTDARLTRTSCAGTLSYDSASSSCVTPGAPPARPIATAGDALLGAPWSFTMSSEYNLPEWQGRAPYLRIDFQHSTAQKSLLPGQNPNNGAFDNTLPGLPVVNNLSLRVGLRFNGFDLSAYANNVTNAHPLLVESRDIAPNAGPPGTAASELGPTTDNLYFGRGVRPRTIGVTAAYRY